jgi:hypothetical protein
MFGDTSRRMTRLQGGQFDAVVDSEIQPDPAQRIVDVDGVASEERAALAERGRDALMHVIEIAMNNRIGTGLREKSLPAAAAQQSPRTPRPRFPWAG